MITEDTEFTVLLPVQEIPNGSIVTKKTGSYEYILRHDITIYQYTVKTKDAEDAKKELAAPMPLKGYFIVSDRGGIEQVQPDTVLAWRIPAGALRDFLYDHFLEDDG